MILIKKLLIKIFEIGKRNNILTGILLIALLLRFIGVYPGYHPYHSDEGMSYSSAIEMIRNLNIDPTRYDYPSLIPLINAFFYIIFFIPLFILKNLNLGNGDLPTKGRNLIELWQQVVIQNQQTEVLFWGRYVTAAFGVGVVFLTYLVAMRLFGDRRIGLVAAFITAVNFRQVLNSHLGLPDIYNGFFLLLSLYVIVLLLKKPTLKYYFLAGLTAGLYFSTKFQIFIVPAFLLIHLRVAWETLTSNKLQSFIKRLLNIKIFIACVIALVVIVIVNPYHLINWNEFLGVNSYTALKYTIGIKTINFYPLLYLFHIGLGEIISLIILLGILIGLRKFTFSSIILLSIVFPFFYVFAYYTGGGYYVRNFVTITPLLLIFASVFVVELCKFLFKNRQVLNIAILVIVVLISYEQTGNSVFSSYYFSKPWGFKEAHDFAEVNIPDGAKIVSHPWDKYPRDRNYEIIPFEVSEIFSLAEMREDGANYGFLNMDWITLGSYWWMHMDWKSFLNFKGGRPDSILENGYTAAAAQELASFTVAKFVKPPQAPDMNFLIVKIPGVAKFEKKEILSFSFDGKDQFLSWHKVSFVEEGKNIKFDPEAGNISPGSIKLEQGIARYPVFIAKSPPIPVSERKFYFVEGWIKTSVNLTKKGRDGILRVDFYDHKPSFMEDKILYSSVSSRIYGDPVWHKKEISVFPPEGARFMTVGLQVNNYDEFWFDDIKVYESTREVPNPRKVAPYLDYRIPSDILFPYSQGGM